MSQSNNLIGNPVKLSLGKSKGSATIYAQLKNGSVWALNAPSRRDANQWIKFINAQGALLLNGWKRVRAATQEPRSAKPMRAQLAPTKAALLIQQKRAEQAAAYQAAKQGEV